MLPEIVRHGPSFFLLLRPNLPMRIKVHIVQELAKIKEPIRGIGLLTSGTTGLPKIAVSQIKHHIASAKASQKILPIGTNDRWLLNLPLFHVSGLSILFRCFLHGAKVTLEPKDATIISCVPTQLLRLENPEKYRAILVGGAALFGNVKGAIHPTYGMTEMCSQIATNGKLLPHVDCKIIDGEICVRGPSLFDGYLKNGRVARPDRQGYFPTGDFGELGGRELKVIGRRDRMFISGGENIYPEEIERCLEEIQGVLKARVEPQKCSEWGARPIAYLLTARELKAQSIREALLEKLEKWKVPSEIFQQTR